MATPPPLPPGAPRRGSSRNGKIFVAIVFFLCVVVVCFFIFRTVQFAIYMRTHPRAAKPGETELHDARKSIISDREGVAHGNSPEARKLAGDLSAALKTFYEMNFTHGETLPMDAEILSKGKFLVFCQLNEESCAFLIHVPEMRNYESSAREVLAKSAYVKACSLMDSASKMKLRKLAVATRGNILYDTVLIGEKGFQEDDPSVFTRNEVHDGLIEPELYPFFASPAAALQTPPSPAR